MPELSFPFPTYSLLNSNIDKTLMLSIAIAIKLRMLNAKYIKARGVLYFLKIGNKIAAITTEVMPLKNKSKVEIMISVEFADVAVR